MFTVILLSDAAKKIFDRFEPYFSPFEEEGQLAFCEWNQSNGAIGLREAVPDLPEIIQGKSAWRAVIVDHPRDADSRPDDTRDIENPFDFLDNTDPSLNLVVSKHALIRLTHTLLGYPQMTAKSFRPILRYEDSDSGRIVEGDPRVLLEKSGYSNGAPLEELNDEEVFALAARVFGAEHNNVQRIFTEDDYTEEEKRKHTRLVDKYKMNEVRPSEVILISTRVGVQKDEKLALKKAWSVHDEQHTSRFVERNDYPPMSRFAVYELLEEENSGYEQDLLRFWLGVLTLATNLLPPGGFQADRLYQLDIEFGKEALGDMLNEHISQLASVRDRLFDLIQAPPPPPSLEVTDLMQPVETRVELENLGGTELRAATNGYGLAKDKPHDEYRRWSNERTRVAHDAADFMRKPRRFVGRSVRNARDLAQIQDAQVVSLDEIERDELQDDLAKRLHGLVVPATSAVIDPEGIQRTIRRSEAGVRGYITKRMTATAIWIASAVALGIWVLAFVPYLFQAARMNTVTFLDAGLVVLLALAVIIGAGLVTLFVFRWRLLKRIRDFNEAVDQHVQDVRSSATLFSDYLSKFVTYRRGARRLRRAHDADVSREYRKHRLRRTREEIIQRIEDEKAIVRGLDATVVVQRSYEIVEFDPDNEDLDNTLFRFPRGERKIPFNNSGEFVDAPYDFITTLRLHRIPLYEPEVTSA